jgi:hypothetical protein
MAMAANFPVPEFSHSSRRWGKVLRGFKKITGHEIFFCQKEPNLVSSRGGWAKIVPASGKKQSACFSMIGP